jgi:outer membrane protein OmpA-like peptidoglycan-associated protein
MQWRLMILLMFLSACWGCGAGVNLDSKFRDFDDYEKDLREVAVDPRAMETLESGAKKRDAAGEMLAQGKDVEAVTLADQALADAHLALEMDRMEVPSHRAEKCRLEAEHARTAWREALFLLEQTEEFVGKKASLSSRDPMSEVVAPLLPTSILTPQTFPPATMADVSQQWKLWRNAARENKVAVADLETVYRHSVAETQAEKAEEAIIARHRYLAARAAQSLECRVRAQLHERGCLDATQRTAAFGDASAEALRATLELERGLQDDLRGELSQLRAEAKSRQDELYDALSQMEGKFASIRRDARGTIVSLADILFDFDEATLRRDVEFNLVKIATILNQFGEMNILIEGHTDSIGTEEYNLGLSQRRAQAVQDFLITQDVAGVRLASEGYGESRPVADNDTEEGRQQNRRVDLVIQDLN